MKSLLIKCAMPSLFAWLLRLHRAAGWLLAPYLTWVSFATLLTLSILLLNQAVLLL
ncbi:tryptophan-rich sensory protein [Cesiribacter andamanensis]|uniref:TspO/MBR family protein n=1 Tax=Cesiribacter andamanensis AMV16 TaxID=1279009 RepID=M7N9G3_9BACT|nr:tryptophan-rich sensory protein [Cesiribacter andamanensis]EMR03902.1 TspO/MBR family protein [Cesiribacter andamanensis AMV16]